MLNPPLTTNSAAIISSQSMRMKSPVDFCFNSPDILTYIANAMDGDRGSLEIEEDLVTFACICRATEVPALRVLWREQRGLDNLLKTLPRDAWTTKLVKKVINLHWSYHSACPPWEEKRRVFVSSYPFTAGSRRYSGQEDLTSWCQYLNRSLSSFEWERFDFYAAFIKVLVIEEIDYPELVEWSPRVWSALQLHQSFLQRDLLPNLQKFKWGADEEFHFSQALLFLPPHALKHIVVESGHWQMDEGWSRALLSYFPNVSPKVEHIELKMYTSRVFDCVHTVDIRPLLGCIHLRSLICELEVSVLQSAVELSQLPNLETLSLTFKRQYSPEDRIAPPPIPSVFHHVKSLKCNSSPEFLQACRFPVLQCFSTKDTWRIRDSLDALFGHCSLETLSGIKIAAENYRCRESEFLKDMPSYLSKDDLQGLLSFCALESVIIEVGECLWGDEELELLASAWPGLKKLTILSVGREAKDDNGFTLPGLVHLVKNCLDLESLSVGVGEQSLPFPPSDLPDKGRSNLHLEAIELRGPDITMCQCDAAAAFLYCLFPNLRRIESHGDRDLQRPGWKRVEELLRLFGTVRAHMQR